MCYLHSQVSSSSVRFADTTRYSSSIRLPRSTRSAAVRRINAMKSAIIHKNHECVHANSTTGFVILAQLTREYSQLALIKVVDLSFLH